MEEMHRVLKKGGNCFIYVPFLYLYHASAGYYHDYWRFTKDSLEYLSRDYKHFEIQNVRFPTETLVSISPFGRNKHINAIARYLDKLLNTQNSPQTSGYYVFLTK
jgi:hypothetical protein